MKLAPTCLLIAVSLCACATPPRPAADWRGFARCAAAYRVNAALADPARGASMTAMVSEVADEYATAAVRKYKAAQNASDQQALDAVDSLQRSAALEFGGLPREKVEGFIESCPQPDE